MVNMEIGRIIFGVVMCVIYFFAWMFLMWEVVKKVEGKNGGWIILTALGSSLCSFLCGLLLAFLCFNC